MKRFTKVLGIFTITLTSLGIFFKILHLPGGTLFFVIGAALLSFIFLPVFLLQKVKRSKTTIENLQIIFGLIIAMVMSISFLFLVQHWPGGAPLLIFSSEGLCLIFLPLYLLPKIQTTKTAPENLQVIFGLISGMVMSMTIPFMVLHWPWRMALLLTSLGIFIFLFLPAYYFSKTDKKKAV